jgi:protein-S-isoprenylcysteine O-methyltransferase Ste14
VSRFAVTALFAFFATASAVAATGAFQDAVADPSLKAWAVVGYTLLRLGVVIAFSFFVFVREPARRPSRDPVAFVACATAVAALVALRGPGDSATSLVVVGDIVALVSCVWLLASVLALGRCFGVLPEARGLVTRGPYRFVRHPVYLGELGACIGLVIAAPTAWNFAMAAAFAAAQSVRMRLEERALTAEFPEYAQYAARTPRLVPRLGLRMEPSWARTGVS